MDLGAMFNSAQVTLEKWGGALLTVIGVVLLIWMGILIAMKFFKKGQDQTSVVLIVIGLLVGGAFVAGGMGVITNLSDVGQSTINTLIGAD